MTDTAGPGPARGAGRRPLTVYFDRSCALCRTEFAALDLAPEDGELRDCSVAGFDDPAAAAAGVTPDAMLRELHVADGYGRWYRGIDAFIQVYRLAGYPRVAAVLGQPWLRPLWDRLYRFVARHRNRLSRLRLDVPLGMLLRRAGKPTRE